MDNLIGKKLDGRYEILQLIGVGGMANVYKARDVIDERLVAVKILREEYASNEEFVRRFKNESKAIAALNHPNIVKVYDVSFSDKMQSIVMEYIDGITLKDYIDQQKIIRWKEAVHFTVQILRALQHAHDKGIVHRDIKPQNIMLLQDGTIKVMDFGIARFARSQMATITDKAIGSVHYISPEQARGEKTDEKTDLYSVGVMLFEMLTGKLPFTADSAVSVAIQQMIAIARAVDMKCKVLILDEPTSSLDDEEVEKLFVLMRRLREEGVGIIFVTHFLEQVYAVCDRITVLRNGELVGEYETKDLPRVMLVAKMMGKDFDDLADIKGDRKDKKVFSETPVIEAEGIGHKGTIRPFDLKINKGEVIGLTGLLGSGRSELVRSIYGADKADSGTLKVNGKEVKINSPLDAMKLGMAYLPEDRKAEGIIADLSVRENIIIAMQAKKGMFHPMSRKEMEEAADKYIDMLQIKTASRETPIKSLSGGNQQKVILGRWLLTNPEYLILDEPTRGIDIGTKTEIQKIVLDLADQGMAVTFISSEVEEMLRTCSRMAVLRDGEKVGELEESELSQSNIMKAIAGGDDKNE